MKKIFILSAIFLIPLLALSQVPLSTDFEVKLGERYKVIDADYKEYFSLSNERAFAVKTDKNRVFLQIFDTKSNKEIIQNSYNDFPKGMVPIEIIHTAEKFYYVYSFFDRENKRYKVAAREINVTKGSLGRSRTLFSTRKKVHPIRKGLGEPITAPSAQRWNDYPLFKIFKSYDNSKFLFRYISYKEKGDKAARIGFQVFDENLRKVWGKEALLPYTKFEIIDLTYGVLKNGTAFSIIHKMKGGTLELYMRDGKGNSTTKEIALPENYTFSSASLKENKEGNLTCAILYTEGVLQLGFDQGGGLGVGIKTNGLLYINITPEAKVLSTNSYKFSPEFIKQYMKKGQKKKVTKDEQKNTLGIDDLKLLESFNQEDGSTIFLCERQWIATELRGPDNATTYFRFADIVILKINEDGSLAWMKKIPKYQEGVHGKGQMGYKYIAYNNNHYIIYVDNPKNLNISVDESPAKHVDRRGGFLTICKMDDETGKYEKHTVLDMDDIEGKTAYQFQVTRIFDADIEKQVFLMECYLKSKKDAMVKIKFK